MDLISALSSQLGIDPSAAKAVAGTALGGVRDQVAEKAGPEQAEKLDFAVPELDEWRTAASAQTGGYTEAPTADGLMGTIAGAVGGEQATQLATMAKALGAMGIDPAKAAMAAPVVLSFLQERLPEDQLKTVLSAAPFLTGGEGDAKSGIAGAAMGALGSFF